MNWREQGGEQMSNAQRRMLNAVCGDLSAQMRWHAHSLSKNDFRHVLAGTILGWRMMPGIDRGEGSAGWIMLGGSSLDLSKSQAADAITLGLSIGDDPSAQNINSRPVVWSDAVLLGLGHNPNDFKDQAA